MRKKKIAVIGAGIAALTLAYAIRKDDLFDVTVYAAKNADEIRNGRIPSTQIHFDRFLRTEERFGIGPYGDVYDVKEIELLVGGQKMFKGRVNARAVSIDQREYLAALQEGLKRQGADVRKRRASPEDISLFADEYDLIVDCTGKIGPVVDFPIYDRIRNAPVAPQRVCSAGMFRGLAPDEEQKMAFNIVPGLGELFETSTMTRHGPARVLLFEPIPGSEMDCIKGDKGPDVFAKEMLGALDAYFPHIRERVDPNEFRLVDPNAYMRVAIKPELRIPYATANGTLALGCGDSVALNDPITGQGANAASYCAEALYDVLAEHRDATWDSALGERYWDRTREFATKMTEWTNGMMGPLSDSFSELLGRATQNQAVADEVVGLFLDPIQAHRVFFASSMLEA
ncbi:styrene monooxygenase [Paenibacillus antri]|uniref:Styrene monooxygenase n=1 Tax=Paenibacillus antri TaxID=2582848 RepID=A0A5R9FZ21_9BACL|nr:styrene monooxygenase/indole monooxygenase family protein [Paenibacillus antri]TLS48761.1 styrene monooxygenase [Paenibacillus antri]